MDAGNFLKTRSGIGMLFDDSQEQTMDELRKNQALYEGINVPQMETYSPEEARYQMISNDPEIRAMQTGYLNKLMGLSETGLSDADEASYQRNAAVANQNAASNRAANMQSAEARGVAGGGMQYALDEMGNQGALNRAHESGLQQAADSARQRALYTQAYGSALNDQQQQNTSLNAANADIINRFNQYNTGNRNEAKQYNNNLTQQGFQNRLGLANAKAGGNTAMAQGYAAQNAANAQGRDQDTKLFGTIMGMTGGKGG